MTDRPHFAERLQQAMLDAGYAAKPIVLQKQFNTRWNGRGVSFQAARAWLIGTSKPEHDKLKVLADWLNVSPGELLYGIPEPEEVREPAPEWLSALSMQDRRGIEALMMLPPAHRQLVMDLVRALASPRP